MEAKIIMKETQQEFPAIVLEETGEIIVAPEDLDKILATMATCPYRQHRLRREEATIYVVKWWDAFQPWWRSEILRAFEGRITPKAYIFRLNDLTTAFTITSHHKAFVVIDGVQVGYWEHFLEDKEKRARWAAQKKS